MAEVKTQPVVATHIPDKEKFRDEYGQGNVPGSFRVTDPDANGNQRFWLCCPCGCRSIAPIVVGNGFKPAGDKTWNWNGSFDKPTLHPSVHDVGHWHGYLRNGIWESV